MSDDIILPRSPKDEVMGFPYFARMCHKIRLNQAGELHSDYQPNLGKGFDLWICEFFEVSYDEVAAQVKLGHDDESVIKWVLEHGKAPTENENKWWQSYMRNRGFNDDLSERMEMRKVEAGLGGREDIRTFFDFIDAEEGR